MLGVVHIVEQVFYMKVFRLPEGLDCLPRMDLGRTIFWRVCNTTGTGDDDGLAQNSKLIFAFNRLAGEALEKEKADLDEVRKLLECAERLLEVQYTHANDITLGDILPGNAFHTLLI
jgi:hypothetical protein